jgi:hypothetical protein
MVRRNRPTDPLQQPTWLVVRNKHRQALEWRRLARGADLRAILNYERDQRMAAGWTCDDIGRHCSFFFAGRSRERIQVSIERYDPAGPGPRAQRLSHRAVAMQAHGAPRRRIVSLKSDAGEIRLLSTVKSSVPSRSRQTHPCRLEMRAESPAGSVR